MSEQYCVMCVPYLLRAGTGLSQGSENAGSDT